MTGPSLNSSDYTVGWICALPVELAAATILLDEEHSELPQHHNDFNAYTLGRMGEHNVVLACLPEGGIGIAWAAVVAANMAAHFENLKFGLMVGVGGGVPSESDDIRLGDVVISKPENGHGGVVQFDFGKTGKDGKIARKGWLNSPPPVLLTALSKFHMNSMIGRINLGTHLATFNNLPNFRNPGPAKDILFNDRYDHIPGTTCTKCDPEESIRRDPRDNSDPVLHYGTIASANQVMKDAKTRDRYSQELGGILCFEMEAAGLMNTFPCLVIRGICDYSDSHKNKIWQPYAASAAAAVAKDLLRLIPRNQVTETEKVMEAVKVDGRYI